MGMFNHSLKGGSNTGATLESHTSPTSSLQTPQRTPSSSTDNLTLLPSNEQHPSQTKGQDENEDTEKQVLKSKTKKKFLGLTMDHWCYVWLAFCIVGGIVGGTIGAVYGKGTRYGGKTKNH